jgi:hypothetical protein
VNGPRPAAGAGFPCTEFGRSAPGGQTVRVCVGAATFTNSTWISLPGGTPSGRRYPRVCLGIGRSSKTALDDVESKRGED